VKRVILDEGVPKILARKLRENGIDAVAFPNDWKQVSDGTLLSDIERQGFQVLVTNDKRMQFQQNMASRNLAVLVLPTNNRIALLEMVAEVADALQRAKPGEFLHIETRSVVAPNRRA
jgi:predicted nuclease of predicted toxin-antitoxin system